ncbi:phospholipid scramblase 2-like [Dermacentor albipictus]|uniref:phospholipid scramblase 2-like n=1 Tax=Dermacentor albipictus TaxID=60249 RepID=UPI0031FCA821
MAPIQGIEACNCYIVTNSMGQFIYNIAEKSSCCAQCCCRNARRFEMDVLDHRNAVVMHFVRPLRCMLPWCCCCQQEIEVQAPPGYVVAVVRQEWSMCYPKFSVNDCNSRRVLDIAGPSCKSSTPCKSDVEFEVRSTNGVFIGKITKLWGGVRKELFTIADNFVVTFPLDLDAKFKGALIAATMLIDYRFFESRRR